MSGTTRILDELVDINRLCHLIMQRYGIIPVERSSSDLHVIYFADHLLCKLGCKERQQTVD